MSLTNMFKKVNPAIILELFGIFVALKHMGQTSKDKEELEQDLNDLAKNSKYGAYIKFAKPFMKVGRKGWEDERNYDEALGEISTDQRFFWFNLIYRIAKDEPKLFNNFVHYLANLPKDRRVAVLKEIIENCDDEKSLKKVIIARGADDPDAGEIKAIETLRKWFVETGAEKIGEGFKKAGEGIKKAAETVSTETGKANQRMSENLQTSGLVAWSERLLTKSKK